MQLRKNKNTPTTSRRPSGAQPQAPVFSYYSKRSQDVLRPTAAREAIVERRSSPRLRSRDLPVVLSVLLIVVTLLYTTTLSADPRLEVVAPDGIAQRSTDEYTAAGATILQSSWMHHSKLTIDTDDIANQLRAQFPEFSAVTVNIPLLGRRPAIVAEVAKPAFVVVSGLDSYFVGPDGRAAAQLRRSPPSSLAVLHDQSGIAITPGRAVLTESGAAFASNLVAILKEKNVSVADYILPSAPNEIDIKITGRPYIVRFAMLADVRQQVGTYLAVEHELQSRGVVPAEYIDLRAEERAFYK